MNEEKIQTLIEILNAWDVKVRSHYVASDILIIRLQDINDWIDIDLLLKIACELDVEVHVGFDDGCIALRVTPYVEES